MNLKVTKSEINRLLELYTYDILDTVEEEEYNDIVELASYIADAPISLISLVDTERQWFKAKVGVEEKEVRRDLSICTHAIEQNDPFIVPDVNQDVRFFQNKPILNDPSICFYAGFPLISKKGHKLGTLCVLDRKPKELASHQLNALQKLSRQVIKLMELRINNNRLIELSELEQKQKATKEQLLLNQRKLIAILAHDTRGPLVTMNNLLDMFIKNLVPEKDTARLYRLMEDQVKMTLDMIEGLIKWGELQLKSPDLMQSEISLNSMVDKVFQQYALTASSKCIRFQKEVEEVAGLKMHQAILNFVLRNLVNNSVKYTEGGEVNIIGKKRAAYYELKVSDTGVGMTESVLNSLLQGKAISKNGTQSEKGSGLGILLINDFLQQAGGTLNICSERNAGTVITVSIPYS